MDSEEETLYDNENDSGNESSGSDDVDFAMEVESSTMRDRQTDTDDYPYEVLSTEEIVQHMVDCIKDVNSVVEVCIYMYHCYMSFAFSHDSFLLSRYLLRQLEFYLTTSNGTRRNLWRGFTTGTRINFSLKQEWLIHLEKLLSFLDPRFAELPLVMIIQILFTSLFITGLT